MIRLYYPVTFGRSKIFCNKIQLTYHSTISAIKYSAVSTVGIKDWALFTYKSDEQKMYYTNIFEFTDS